MDPRERFGELNEALLAALEGRQAQIWTAMPGVIQSYDAATQTVTVQPGLLGQFRTRDGKITQVQMPLLLDCPVQFPAGGGYTLTFPVAPGDECLVQFASRCIDSWHESGGTENVPLEYRMHDLSDGFASLGYRSKPRVLKGASGTNVALRTDDPNLASIEIAPNGLVSIFSAELLSIVSNKGGVLISGDVRIVGKLTVSGEGTFRGTHTVTQHVHPTPGTSTPEN